MARRFPELAIMTVNVILITKQGICVLQCNCKKIAVEDTVRRIGHNDCLILITKRQMCIAAQLHEC